MKTLYLVNNKPAEPKFAESFKAVASEQNLQYSEIEISNLSFYVDKNSAEIEFYNGDQKLPLQQGDQFYIRARKPLASPTACLGFALHAAGFKINELQDSTEHNLRGSKVAQGFIMKPYGVRFPNSFVTNVENVPKIKSLILQKINFPLVLKQSGSKGEKVWKCDTEKELDELTATLMEDPGKLVQFQEYIPNTFDIRVIVLYGQIIASIARSSADGFYNNVSQGGAAESIELTEEEKEIALIATKESRLELAGIDIVRSEHGPLLFEINKSPDITAFDEAAGFDIGRKIAEEFLKQ